MFLSDSQISLQSLLTTTSIYILKEESQINLIEQKQNNAHSTRIPKDCQKGFLSTNQKMTDNAEVCQNPNFPNKGQEEQVSQFHNRKQIQGRCRSFSTNDKSKTQKNDIIDLFPTKLLMSVKVSQQPIEKNSSTKMIENIHILNQTRQKQNSTLSNQHTNIRQKSKSEKFDSREHREQLIQKKANCYFNLQNFLDFHSKKQLLKSIRSRIDYCQIPQRHNSIDNENVSQENENKTQTRNFSKVNMDNIDLKIDEQQLNKENSQNIQENDFILESQINNHLISKFGQNYYKNRKNVQQKQKKEQQLHKNKIIKDKEQEFKTSDYFFHGGNSFNSKNFQVRVQINSNQDENNNNNKKCPNINIFSDAVLENQQSSSKSFGLSDQKIPYEDKVDSKTKISLSSNTLIPSIFLLQQESIDLSKQFSIKLLQQDKTNILPQPPNLRNKSLNLVRNIVSIESTPMNSSGQRTPSISQSKVMKGDKSPSTNRHSTFKSAFDSGSMMYIVSDEEEMQTQKKRRKNSPLNYLFHKYPEVIKENYSFMKMKMKQIVDIYDVQNHSAEEQLIDEYQNYSDSLISKVKDKMMKQSSKSVEKQVPLLNIKKGLSVQQKKVYSQINKFTHEIEVNKRQVKYLINHQNSFNKKIMDLDNQLIPSSEFNVSDFIYKNYLKSKNGQEVSNQQHHIGKRLCTQ